MLVPLAVLALGAVLAGILFENYFIGGGYEPFWGKALSEGPENHIRHAMHEVPQFVAWAPTLAMLAGFVLAYLFYVTSPGLPEATARRFRPLYLFLLNKWYFDELYDWLFVRPALWLGRAFWLGGDRAVIDGVIDGTAATVAATTRRVVGLQTGYVYHYAFAMLIGVALLVSYFMFAGGILK
jgi:NADH-quinone oxidoreductase subunit L